MTAEAPRIAGGVLEASPARWRTRGWAIVGALSVTETVSWGIVYYAFAVFLVPMERDLGLSTAQLTGAFSLALLISAIAGVAVGRYLDRHGPRALMTAGSVAATGLVLAWSQVEGLAAFYLLWVGMGLVMATVLYEPAFTVLAKWFTDPAERRRALTALTLVAALASFIFLPLAQALIDAYGWRDALVILAAILGAVTIPLHAFVLRRPHDASVDQRAAEPSTPAGEALRSGPFWLLTGAFFLASVTGIAMTIHAIPFLLERGEDPAFAAFAVGLIGFAQIPGRVIFALAAERLPRELAIAAVFATIATGIAVIVGLAGTVALLIGFVLLGMGNGMTTLARAAAMADHYGPGGYGTIAGVAGAVTTVARAAGPVAAAVFAAAAGYTAVLWTLAALAGAAAVLAHRAERSSRRADRGGRPRPARAPPIRRNLGSLESMRRWRAGLAARHRSRRRSGGGSW